MTITSTRNSPCGKVLLDRPVHIAVTDRENDRQKGTLELLLDNEVVIEWVNSTNEGQILLDLQTGQIDGVILTAWRGQPRRNARQLDQRLLEQHRSAIRPVPLLAIGEGMVSLLQSVGGRATRWDGPKVERQVSFTPDSYLRRWANMDGMWVKTDHLPDLIPPGRADLTINATSLHGQEWIVEGFEVLRGAIQVGVYFDPVELYLLNPTGDATWSPTPDGAGNIVRGFVAEVRGQTEN